MKKRAEGEDGHRVVGVWEGVANTDLREEVAVAKRFPMEGP